MKQLNLFMAILALTCIAFFPATARADGGLDDLEVTMVVLDDASDLGDELAEMRGPDDEVDEHDGYNGDETDGDESDDHADERDEQRDREHDEEQQRERDEETDEDERHDEERSDREGDSYGDDHADNFEHDDVFEEDALEHFLRDVLGKVVVADHAMDKSVDPIPVAGLQLGEAVFDVSRLEARHQLVVGALVDRLLELGQLGHGRSPNPC